jgi:hypothetical protein
MYRNTDGLPTLRAFALVIFDRFDGLKLNRLLFCNGKLSFLEMCRNELRSWYFAIAVIRVKIGVFMDSKQYVCS